MSQMDKQKDKFYLHGAFRYGEINTSENGFLVFTTTVAQLNALHFDRNTIHRLRVAVSHGDASLELRPVGAEGHIVIFTHVIHFGWSLGRRMDEKRGEVESAAGWGTGKLGRLRSHTRKRRAGGLRSQMHLLSLCTCCRCARSRCD